MRGQLSRETVPLRANFSPVQSLSSFKVNIFFAHLEGLLIKRVHLRPLLIGGNLLVEVNPNSANIRRTHGCHREEPVLPIA
jgi:hypothetical protein